eukprot:g6555.t1
MLGAKTKTLEANLRKAGDRKAAYEDKHKAGLT